MSWGHLLPAAVLSSNVIVSTCDVSCGQCSKLLTSYFGWCCLLGFSCGLAGDIWTLNKGINFTGQLFFEQLHSSEHWTKASTSQDNCSLSNFIHPTFWRDVKSCWSLLPRIYVSNSNSIYVSNSNSIYVSNSNSIYVSNSNSPTRGINMQCVVDSQI